MIEVIGYLFIGLFFGLLGHFLRAWAESKKEWIGLTEDEILEAWHWGGAGIEGAHFKVLYNYFEHKLREKNEN